MCKIDGMNALVKALLKKELESTGAKEKRLLAEAIKRMRENREYIVKKVK
jgi:hypothetical protein